LSPCCRCSPPPLRPPPHSSPRPPTWTAASRPPRPRFQARRRVVGSQWSSVVKGCRSSPLAYLGPASAAAARPESLLSSSGVGESVLGCCASASLRSSSPRGAPAPVESIVKPPDARALHPHPATSLSDRSDRLSLSASPPSLRLSCLFGAFEYPPPYRGGRLNPHVAVRMRFWGTCP